MHITLTKSEVAVERRHGQTDYYFVSVLGKAFTDTVAYIGYAKGVMPATTQTVASRQRRCACRGEVRSYCTDLAWYSTASNIMCESCCYGSEHFAHCSNAASVVVVVVVVASYRCLTGDL